MIRNLTQSEIIDMLNTCCDSAVELLELKTNLEATGHTLQWEARSIYDINMHRFYETDKIA